MLCRAVLTAVAISCTFSRALIGQGSPRKDQIKDLICVLWLSGMQKEDLDVNMLRKLQRHNVNIDNMRPEALQKQCIKFNSSKGNVTKEDKDNNEEDENKTTTESVTLNNESIQNLIKSDLKLMMNNLMSTRTVIEEMTEKEETTSMFPSPSENAEIIHANTENNILNYPLSYEQKHYIDVKYKNFESKLENIINQMFSNTTSTYNKIDSKIRKPLTIKPRLKEEINEQRYLIAANKDPKEADYLNKLLAEILHKSTTPTTVNPTTTPVDLNKLSDRIERLLKLYPQSGTLGDSNNFPEREVEIVNNLKPSGYNFFKNGIPTKASILDKRIKEYEGYKRNNQKHPYPHKTPNIASFPNRIPKRVLKNTQRGKSVQRQLENKIIFEPTFAPSTIITNTRNIASTKFVNDNKTNNNVVNISKDCIKEIAENVKTIVLKDLRKEITSTAASPSVVTTIRTTTTSPITKTTTEMPLQNKKQEATQVIAKLMELVEQITGMKQTTETISDVKKKSVNVTHRELDNYLSPIAPKIWFDPYTMKKPRGNSGSPTYSGMQRPAAEQYFPMQSANPYQINNIPLTSQRYQKKQGIPITIQTNSGEIPPLGIPLPNPLKIIHQNIVVTTMRSILASREYRDKTIDSYERKDIQRPRKKYRPYQLSSLHLDTVTPTPFKNGKLHDFDNIIHEKNSFDRYKDDRFLELKQQLKENSKSIDPRPYMNDRLQDFKTSFNGGGPNVGQLYTDDKLPEFKDFVLYKETKHHLNVKPPHQIPKDNFKYSIDSSKRVEHKTPYDGSISFDFNYKKGNMQKHSDNISYGVLSRGQNHPRFHEKLERVEDWRDDSQGKTQNTKKCVKLEVTSRQQQPLNVMKESRFDDTHFNNFLKTQQKVNDMLEKILSSKTNPVGPHSVETT